MAIERTPDDEEWRAAFKTEASAAELAPEGIGVMSCEAPNRRTELEHLLTADDLDRERSLRAWLRISRASG